MRHGKRPTKAQRIQLTRLHLNHRNWLVIRDDKKLFVIQHRLSGKVRTLNREHE